MEDATPAIPPPGFPTPESAARCGDPVGTEVTLADGRVWTLAPYIPAYGLVWDELYDGNIVFGRYQLADVLLGAARLLLEHYDLPLDFAAWLLLGADPDDLVRAIEWALFGGQKECRSYSDWAEGAFWANGIDPATVPPQIRRRVLDQLVATGRAVPHLDYTSAGKAAVKRANLLALNDKIDEARKDFGAGQPSPPPSPAAPPTAG